MLLLCREMETLNERLPKDWAEKLERPLEERKEVKCPGRRRGRKSGELDPCSRERLEKPGLEGWLREVVVGQVTAVSVLLTFILADFRAAPGWLTSST